MEVYVYEITRVCVFQSRRKNLFCEIKAEGHTNGYYRSLFIDYHFPGPFVVQQGSLRKPAVNNT